MAKQTRYAVPIKCIALAALLSMGGTVLDAADAPEKASRGLSLRSANDKKIQEQSSAETATANQAAPDGAPVSASQLSLRPPPPESATDAPPAAEWSVQARPAKNSGDAPWKDGRGLSLRSKKIKRQQEQSATAKANPDLWAMQSSDPYEEPASAAPLEPFPEPLPEPEPYGEPYGSGVATGEDEYVVLPGPPIVEQRSEPPLEPYSEPPQDSGIDYYIPQPTYMAPAPAPAPVAAKPSVDSADKGLRLRGRRPAAARASAAPAAPAAPAPAIITPEPVSLPYDGSAYDSGFRDYVPQPVDVTPGYDFTAQPLEVQADIIAPVPEKAVNPNPDKGLRLRGRRPAPERTSAPAPVVELAAPQYGTVVSPGIAPYVPASPVIVAAPGYVTTSPIALTQPSVSSAPADCDTPPRKVLRLRRSRVPADCATGAITVPSVSVNMQSVPSQYEVQYGGQYGQASTTQQIQSWTSDVQSGAYPEPLPAGITADVTAQAEQVEQAKSGQKSEDESYYDKYHNVITDNPHDQDEKIGKKQESTVQVDKIQPHSENYGDQEVNGARDGSPQLPLSGLSGGRLSSDGAADRGEYQSREQESGYQSSEPPERQMRPPAPPPQPTREEVEDYRQRLELRLLERYNNLPEHAGNVGRVEVVLSRPLEVSLDGSRIKAEFDQLVYDPWGRRIPKLEEEYFVVTFAAGGARQVRSDPSVRVGLDHEQGFSERMPLSADPFAKVQQSKAFAPAPKPAKETKKMADWWRPDFPELR